MRIGVLTSVGRTLDAFFVEMVRDWQERGHVVFTAAGTAPAADVPFDLIAGLGQRPGPENLRTPWRLAAWAAARELDVVLTNTATASTLVRIPRMPCKVVYFCHGLHWNSRWHPAKLVEQLLARRCDAVIAINSDDHAWLSQRHPHVRFLREGVGVPDDRYAWSPAPIEGPPQLLWAGDLVPRKRPQLAVQVSGLLLDAGVDHRLTMLGDGLLLDETRRQVAARGLDGIVTCPGRAPVEEHVRSAHALLHTAAWEGLPRILLEGLVMGRRAYAFDVKGVRDVPYAVLAPDADVAALAGLIADDPRPEAIDPAAVAGFRTSRVSRWLEAELLDVVG